MATNKNQHFVPRCHLRPFTHNAEDAAISLFNLQRKRLIKDAPVKNQCSRDYFYGKDEQLEQAIQTLEGGYGRALREILLNSRSLTEGNETVFRLFWIFQHLRTEAAALRAVEMANSTRLLADLPPEEFSLGIKDAVQMACRAFASSMHEIDDLKFCILKNKTEVPFITSDNPAVLTNRWRLDTGRDPGHSFGMRSAGTLTFLPLTPKLLFLGYDGDVYNVSNDNGVVELRSPRDVIALNRHQFLQCVANVYVHDHVYEKMLADHFSAIEHLRPIERHIIHYAEFDKVVNGHKRYKVVVPEERDKTKEAMMHSQVVHPHPNIWPSQIRLRANGSVYTNGTGVGYVRHSKTFSPAASPFWRERP
ncbi:Protein of unknown function [Duganella sacchari]|uniref:DUF4238 domain-containing protein n=1 Tax=Duganella sacchari TaxID=551987 RepID=A0A1M7RES9_9BURK|nr:DUF4238 domain-containing protein [Duganella sacchari]SHN44726.1 Protein of unknown function [Duganella sacchari]